jgi:hypothetical protein
MWLRAMMGIRARLGQSMTAAFLATVVVGLLRAGLTCFAISSITVQRMWVGVVCA